MIKELEISDNWKILEEISKIKTYCGMDMNPGIYVKLINEAWYVRYKLYFEKFALN